MKLWGAHALHNTLYGGYVHACVCAEILRLKAFEPVLLLGQNRFAEVDIRIRVKGGGFTAQIYAVRQAIAKALVAYYQKCKWGGTGVLLLGREANGRPEGEIVIVCDDHPTPQPTSASFSRRAFPMQLYYPLCRRG